MASVIDVLKERGLFKQCSDEAGLEKLFSQEQVSMYCGFDPTGPSLTIGHLVPVMAMAHLQRMGHRPVALVGGGTCRIGDPTGKSEMRKMLSAEQIAEHSVNFRKQLGHFLDFTPGKAIMADNSEWLLKLNYIDMLREVGVHFSVNRMLSFETYKMRWETGLSFIEFNYIILQSYDFMKLNELHGVKLQVGGDDQWGNMVSGVDLTRRMRGQDVFVLTFPLLTTSDGKKMGKTEKGAVYLDPEKTPVFDFYQYWRNIHDDDVAKFMKIFTFLSVSEIEEMCAHRDQRINEAKKRLAYEMTAMVHGQEEAEKAQRAAQAAFAGSGTDLSAIPSAKLDKARLEAGIGVLDLLLEAGLVSSKREARTLIQQGGAFAGEDKILNPEDKLTMAQIHDGVLVLKAGKKRLFRFLIS